MRGQMYLHESRVPLDEADVDRVTVAELRAAQGDLFAEMSASLVAAAMDDGGEVSGCSPFSCRVPGDPSEDEGGKRAWRGW